MTIFLVRHGQAGNRSSWDGDDRDRPLSDRGEAQAEALAELLAGRPIRRVVSSPFTRCQQTVMPLAKRLGLDVEADERLAEGESFVPALALIEQLPDDSVLCSHGDLVPELIDALVRRGLEVVGTPDGRKGARWEIERTTPHWRAHAEPPPDRAPL